jgi:TonB family protein
VDASGRRYDGTQYKGLAPWERDAVKTVGPTYSYADRRDRREGEGVVRLTLNVKTGIPRDVRMLKSTSFPTLDASAIAAFRKWRWRPGRWQQIDIPVTFVITRAPAPAGAIPLPNE